MISFCVLVATTTFFLRARAQELPKWAKQPSPLIYDDQNWPMMWVPMKSEHLTLVQTLLGAIQNNSAPEKIAHLKFFNDNFECPSKPVPGYALTCQPRIVFTGGVTNEDTVGAIMGLHLANSNLGYISNGHHLVNDLVEKIPNLRVIDVRNNSISYEIFDLKKNRDLRYLDVSLNSYTMPRSSSLFSWLDNVDRLGTGLRFCRLFDLSTIEDNCLGPFMTHELYPTCGPPVDGVTYHACPSREQPQLREYFEAVKMRAEQAPGPSPTPYVGYGMSFKLDAREYLEQPPGTEELPPLPSAFEPGGREYNSANPLVPGSTSSSAPAVTASIVSSVSNRMELLLSTTSVPSNHADSKEKTISSGLNSDTEKESPDVSEITNENRQMRTPVSVSDESYVLIVGAIVGACVIIAFLIGILSVGYYCGKGKEKDRRALQQIEEAVREKRQDQRYNGSNGMIHASMQRQSGQELFSSRNDSIYAQVHLSPPQFDHTGDYGPAPPPVDYDSTSRDAQNDYNRVGTESGRALPYERTDTPFTVASSLRSQAAVEHHYDRVSDTIMYAYE